MDQIAKHLGEFALFANLDPGTLKALAAHAHRRPLGKGALLFEAGDPPDALYGVISGQVRVWTVSHSGHEVTLNILGPGAMLGEIGVLDGSPRSASVSGYTASELLVIGRADLFAAIEADPALARQIITFLCDRLRWVSARMEDSTLRSAPERLARMLVYLGQDQGEGDAGGVVITTKLTQAELARWALMSREALNKIVARWTDEGIITMTRGKILLHDLERLEEIAEIGEE
ncbi:MAG: Crp/Fnr family transcriptional regulator [Neomegalonema sp.]|nr:Crp/Fnr family transcriptional regulator [Neomegalonema sp.]